MRRREFIAGLAGAAAWPLAARAQQGDRVRRIGVLMLGDENDSVWTTRLSAFTQALAELGWTDGRNLRMDVRWGGDNVDRTRRFARELVGQHTGNRCSFIAEVPCHRALNYLKGG